MLEQSRNIRELIERSACAHGGCVALLSLKWQDQRPSHSNRQWIYSCFTNSNITSACI